MPHPGAFGMPRSNARPNPAASGVTFIPPGTFAINQALCQPVTVQRAGRVTLMLYVTGGLSTNYAMIRVDGYDRSVTLLTGPGYWPISVDVRAGQTVEPRMLNIGALTLNIGDSALLYPVNQAPQPVGGIPAPVGKRMRTAILGTPGLQAYYPLDDAPGATSYRDLSPNGYPASLLGGGVQPGVAGLGLNDPCRSMYFAGGIRGTSNLTVFTSEVTFEVWAYTPTNCVAQSLIRHEVGGGYMILAWSTSKHILSNDGGTGGGVASGILFDNKWHHYAMTWKQNTTGGFRSYRDGVLIASTNAANVALPSIANGIAVGGSPAGFGEYPSGMLMAHAAVWNVALSDATIAMHYRAGIR